MNKNGKVIIVNGYPGSGKDTFIDYCMCHVEPIKKCMKVSSIDAIKEAASCLGWNGNKTEKDRDFLAALKKLSIEYNNFPTVNLEQIIQCFNADFFFTIIREPEEIDKLVSIFPYAITVFVSRINHDTNYTNTSDGLVTNYNYNVKINNNGDLNGLKEASIQFMEALCTYNF